MFTEEELYHLRMLLKTEIAEIEDLISSADANDKIELESYLNIIKSIQEKIN